MYKIKKISNKLILKCSISAPFLVGNHKLLCWRFRFEKSTFYPVGLYYHNPVCLSISMYCYSSVSISVSVSLSKSISLSVPAGSTTFFDVKICSHFLKKGSAKTPLNIKYFGEYIKTKQNVKNTLNSFVMSRS